MSQLNFFKIQQIDYSKLESKLVSIILCTFREKPKFELLYKTLSQQTIKNFEVVIADYLYDKRKDQIKKLSEKYHIPTVHVERDKFGVHAFNVGIVHSAGDYMIHINDANYFPYRFIEKHMLVCTNNFLSLGARYFAFSIDFPIEKYLTAQIEVPEKQEKKISNKINKRSQIEKYLYLNFGEHQIISPQDFRLLGLPNDLITSENILLEALPGWSYGGSIAGPTELFLELNGFDEEYDKGYGWSDCISIFEEIYTKDGIKRVGNLKLGDMVLSYDFNNKAYVYKPIIKTWERGKLPINRVHLRNGQTIDISGRHPLMVRVNKYNRKFNRYEKKNLNDINLKLWWEKTLPIAKKIPYEVNDVEWLNEDLCFVVGHFLAEGWKRNYNVSTSGYACIKEIIPKLEKNNIPFSRYTNNSGVPCINFLHSTFKQFLRTLKNNSLDIHLPEELFHLPKNKINALLDGFRIGDGYISTTHKDKRGYTYNQEYGYSTISEQLTKDLVRLHLQIGKPLHIQKCVNHGGLGKYPIWRLYYNPNSRFCRDYGYLDLSEVSISFIEKLGRVEMRDFEVKDTHNFVFKNGLISHNCDLGVRAFNKGYKSFINPSNWCLEIQDQDHNIVFDILPEYKLKESSEHNWKLYEESCEKMKTRVNPEINLREEREKILKLRSEKK